MSTSQGRRVGTLLFAGTWFCIFKDWVVTAASNGTNKALFVPLCASYHNFHSAMAVYSKLGACCV